jgi:hypothetical protein
VISLQKGLSTNKPLLVSHSSTLLNSICKDASMLADKVHSETPNTGFNLKQLGIWTRTGKTGKGKGVVPNLLYSLNVENLTPVHSTHEKTFITIIICNSLKCKTIYFLLWIAIVLPRFSRRRNHVLIPLQNSSVWWEAILVWGLWGGMSSPFAAILGLISEPGPLFFLSEANYNTQYLKSFSNFWVLLKCSHQKERGE